MKVENKLGIQTDSDQGPTSPSSNQVQPSHISTSIPADHGTVTPALSAVVGTLE